jgi:hypothetical protein
MTRARIPTALLLAALVVLAGGLPASAGSGGARNVLEYGDSLAIGTALDLPAYLPGWSLRESTSISRHASDGPPAIRAWGGSLPRVIAVSLGTNDDPSAVSRFSGYVRQIVRSAGPGRCVIWATVVRPPYNGVSYDGYNAVLRRAARTYSNFRLLDWQAHARANPSWFGPDGVHPSASGYRARAAALARLIKSC